MKNLNYAFMMGFKINHLFLPVLGGIVLTASAASAKGGRLPGETAMLHKLW